MFVILTAFSLFHLALGLACLGAAVRLLTPGERALWRDPLALLVAEMLVWVYPIFAFAASRSAWRDTDASHALPLIISPLLWLVLMGLLFAVADFVDDGVLGNARGRQ